MAVTVRRACEADAEPISLLHAEVQALHADALPHWFKPPGETTFPPSAARALLVREDTFVFVADVQGTVAGYVYGQVFRQPETPWRYAQEHVYVHHIGVHAAYRRQGVGQALLEAMETAAGERGIRAIALDFWSFNDTARAFFRSCGFSPDNERLRKPVEPR